MLHLQAHDRGETQNHLLFTMTDKVESMKASGNVLKDNERNTFIESLQVLTSSMPPVENGLEKNTKSVKSNSKRGRKKKKKVPVRFSQPTILPKVFAIQISPQTNIIAPVPTVVSQSTLQNAATKPNGPVVYQPSVASAGQKPILPNTSSKEQSFVSSKAIDDANRSQITREESIKLAGTFQYATNNSEPAQFDVEDVTLGSQGYQKLNRKRLVHNASEKRRKEKINGWITKIASVLFKHCPEKQPKIYILEKAYDFISKGTQPLEQKDGKQDAFTQANPAKGEEFSDLVKKVVELENLLHSLLKVIKTHKIPAPPSLFKSTYTKKLAATHFGNSCNVDVALALDGNIEGSSIQNGSTTVASDFDASGTQPCFGVENSPCSLGRSTETVSHIQLQSLSSSSKQSMYSLDLASKYISTAEASENPSAVEYDLDSVYRRGILQVPICVSTWSSSVAVDQRNSGINIVNSDIFQPNVQPTVLQNQSSLIPLQQVSSENTNNCAPSQNSEVSIVSKLVNSRPQNILNKNVLDLSSDITGGSFEKQIAVNPSDGASTKATRKSLQSNKEAPAKPPSMESQMFVMKNLVHSRNKTALNNYDLFHTVPVSVSCGSSKPAKHAIKQGLNSEGRSLLDQAALAKTISAANPDAVLAEKNVLQSDTGLLSTSPEASFVRIESQLLEVSEPTPVNSEGTAVVCSQVSTSENITANSMQRPSQSLKLVLNAEIGSDSCSDTSSQQLRAPDSQTGPFALQTCHSVTSLLSNTTTSPTENSALSIERILSDSTGFKQESGSMKLNEQTMQFVASNGGDQTRSNAVPRKRASSGRASKRHSSAQTSIPVQVSLNQHDTISSKPSPKRTRKSVPQLTSNTHLDLQLRGTVPQQPTSVSTNNLMNVSNKGKKDDRPKQRRQNHSADLNLPLEGNMYLPKAHNFVSLARKDQRKKNGGNALGQFSTESLLRNDSATNAQALVGDADQEIALPTIVNIFAPASLGNMVNQLPMPTNLSYSQNVNNSSTFPTIQSTFSNFSAEALIGGQIDNQGSVSTMMSTTPTANDNSLTHSDQQSLFTDFSTDALLAGTESNLSYGIDNIMNRSDVVVSNSCISPNWLQANSLIDSSPIRGSFNQGLNIFDAPSNMQGYVASGQSSVMTTPVKWRQDTDQNINLTLSSSTPSIGLWGQNFHATAQKTQRNGQNKDPHKTKGTRSQPSNKRGPSFGDFLLVDSVS